MSTIGNIKLAVDGARKAYGTYADYRDRKVSETYDALSQAAGEYAPKAEQAVETARESAKEFYSESRDKAGNVTKAARTRLEKALAETEKQGATALKDARKSGKKLNRKARRKADRAAKAAAKATGKKESHWVRNLSLAALATSGIVAVAYAVLNKSKKDTPGTQPPRVEVQLKKTVEKDEPEVAEEAVVEPALVYSTETPEGAEIRAEEINIDSAAEEIAADLEETEEAAEAVETEANSDAEAIQADFDKKNAPQRDQSDKK
ncbi:hypothetical protein [Corynebacterium crudilactis]|uniref:Late embryogenesis abundant protein n=1 Tax=Corynebacterium crudilactis TaxID=1652495 RepID=A0A172QQ28_9CORY|nr:hypothetical protein [Corynebacterium crudilactis]ANE02795.1 hypothetical protein ccrud_00130 [Corynebacterium crudilactis]